MNRSSIVLLVFIWTSMYSLAQWNPPKRTVDVKHIHLEITLDEKVGRVWGTATHSLVPLWDDVNTVVLDASQMKISKVTLGNKELTYSHQGRKLHITFDKVYGAKDTLKVAISYSANPKQGIYFIKPDKGYPQKPYQIWTQGEAEENNYWFPCYDYPNDQATTSMDVTVRKPLMAISNGGLEKVTDSKDGVWRTFHWKMSIPYVSYLVTLVVGEFAKLEEKVDDIPLEYYVQKKDVKNAMQAFQQTPKMMQFLNKMTGIKYPYEKYAQVTVEDFMWGGMENVTATTLNMRVIRDSRAHLDGNEEGLIVHELAHHWWGDLLTCRNWSHLWLNEGFATYSESLWFEKSYGIDRYKEDMNGSRDWYISSGKHPVIWTNYENLDDIFDSHAYAKGSWILHMLRHVVGDKDFFRGVQLYTKRHQRSVVTTNDLRYAFEDTSGKNLQWFFDQWTKRSGHPKFKVDWKWDSENKMAMVRVRQTQAGALYRTPLVIELNTAKKVHQYRVDLDAKDQKLYLPCETKPRFVAFDKDGLVLKELDFPKKEEESVQQLRYDTDVYGRIAAAKQLIKYPSPQALAALTHAVVHDKSYWVRANIATVLKNVATKQTSLALLKATEDKKSKVRVAAVKALAKHRGRIEPQIVAQLKKLFETDQSYAVQASTIESLSDHVTKSGRSGINVKDIRSLVKKALTMPSYKNIIRCTVLELFGKQKDPKSSPLLLKWMKYGQPTECRIAALNSFYKINKKRASKMLGLLLGLLRDKNSKIRAEAIDLLKNLGKKEAIPALIAVSHNDGLLSIRLAASRAIKKLQK